RMGEASIHFNFQLLVLFREPAFEIQARVDTILGEAAADTIDGARIRIRAAGYILRPLQLIDIAVGPVAEIVIAHTAGETVVVGNAPVEPDACLQAMPREVAASVLLQEGSGFRYRIGGGPKAAGRSGGGKSCIAVKK